MRLTERPRLRAKDVDFSCEEDPRAGSLERQAGSTCRTLAKNIPGPTGSEVGGTSSPRRSARRTREAEPAAGTTPTREDPGDLPEAAQKARIVKPATCHTLRHFFATHLLMGGYDIRTVQELLGPKSVRTTMIYPHVLNRGGHGVQSPRRLALTLIRQAAVV
jgi:hypothetical protein